MAKINKEKRALTLAYLQIVLAVAALVILICTAVSLGTADNPSVSFTRNAVWRMVCCGCISLIFPYLAIPKIVSHAKTLKENSEK